MVIVVLCCHWPHTLQCLVSFVFFFGLLVMVKAASEIFAIDFVDIVSCNISKLQVATVHLCIQFGIKIVSTRL